MQLKCKINGTAWTIEVISAKEMRKQKTGDIAGLCIASDKIIYLDKDGGVDYQIILHELFHAFASDLHLGDTNNMELDDIEEVFAGMFSEKADKIVRLGKRVFKQLKKMESENE